jgi:hypothetical protein
MLADPHEPLRREVVNILEAAEGIEVARAVAPWLDEPRLAAAHEVTLRLLSHLSFDAVGLAHELADRARGRGCLGSAFSTLVQQGQPELVRKALESSNDDVRGAAATALTQDRASLLRIAEVTPHLALADRHAIARWFLNESSPDLVAFARGFQIDGDFEVKASAGAVFYPPVSTIARACASRALESLGRRFVPGVRALLAVAGRGQVVRGFTKAL